MSVYALLVAVLVGGLLIFTLAESIAPYRQSTGRIRASNVALGALSHALDKLVLPAGLGAIAMHWPYGVLHWIPMPWPVAVVAGVVALDGVKYAQHMLFHKVYFLAFSSRAS